MPRSMPRASSFSLPFERDPRDSLVGLARVADKIRKLIVRMLGVLLVPFLEDSSPLSAIISLKGKNREVGMRVAQGSRLHRFSVSCPSVESQNLTNRNTRIDFDRDSWCAECVPNPHGSEERTWNRARQNESNSFILRPEK